MSEDVATTDTDVEHGPVPGSVVTPGPDDGVDGVVSRRVIVAAAPAQVFELLSDARRHPELDGSGTVREPIGSAGKLYLGRKFTMRMHNVAPYVMANTVVEYDADRLIAWRHMAGHVWRWELAPTGDGQTVVTESFDPRPSPLRAVIRRAGSANAAGIEATLTKLQQRFAA